jgi:hypothetical protein
VTGPGLTGSSLASQGFVRPTSWFPASFR